MEIDESQALAYESQVDLTQQQLDILCVGENKK